MTDHDPRRTPLSAPTARAVAVSGASSATAGEAEHSATAAGPEVPSTLELSTLEGFALDGDTERPPSARTMPLELEGDDYALPEPPRALPTIGGFGSYEIVGRIALGGMAEVLLARENAANLGPRYLVIKRILPEHERDRAFIDMFLDEAQLMMRLRHPNVCHVYRYGQHDGQHFIAMEWVYGASLGKLIRRARTSGGIPITEACRIGSNIADALEHAHRATDEDGRPLGIVHRDVTPDNLMVAFDGSVKLLDFGIAKANLRTHSTQAGVVKGKFAYMSPEQCRGRDVDARTDVFALGVCLYEALTGRNLYRRESEFETMDAIVRGPVPTLAERLLNPPVELERIIATCLAKNPDDRFASAADLRAALERFLAARGEPSPTQGLKALMARVLREELEHGPSMETTPFGSSYHSYHLDGGDLKQAPRGQAELDEPRGDIAELPTLQPPAQGRRQPPPPRAAPQRARAPVDLDELGLGAPVFEGLSMPYEGPPSGAAVGAIDLDAVLGAPSPAAREPSAKSAADERRAGPAHDATSHATSLATPSAAPPRGAPAAMVTEAPLPASIPRPVTGGSPSRPAATALVEAARRPKSPGPWVLVGVLGGLAMVLMVGFAVIRSFLRDDADDAPAPATASTGALVAQTTPTGATLTVDDVEIGPTPARVPLTPGVHTVRLSLPGFADRIDEVRLEPGETRVVTRTLEPLPPRDPTIVGRLVLTSQPPSEVFYEGRPLGRTPLNGVELPAGVVALELVTPDGRRHRRGVLVRAGETSPTHIDFWSPTN